MAAPKKKRSLSIRRTRKATHQINEVKLISCTVCGKMKRSHFLCTHNL